MQWILIYLIKNRFQSEELNLLCNLKCILFNLSCKINTYCFLKVLVRSIGVVILLTEERLLACTAFPSVPWQYITCFWFSLAGTIRWLLDNFKIFFDTMEEEFRVLKGCKRKWKNKSLKVNGRKIIAIRCKGITCWNKTAHIYS